MHMAEKKNQINVSLEYAFEVLNETVKEARNIH